MTKENRIVVGVDGSEASIAALYWACDLATAERLATLQVVTAWIHDPMLDDDSVSRNLAEAGKAHREQLEALVSKTLGERPGCEIVCEAIEGDPADVLVKASEGATMLVLGSHGAGKLLHLLVGSVSGACLRRATCAVTIIPPPARAEGSKLGRLLASTVLEPGPII
ncbi:universal stress protein [Amycolatopsis sp. NPDC059657]|uniref:universal stress protein n=1 Tax=Amycolatopsis sp. NPDC059657 TaxID=3346899 RepID=UPI0036711617